jgi:predicted transcriptional regulator
MSAARWAALCPTLDAQVRNEEIAKALKIGRASVYRVLEAQMIGASLVTRCPE